MAWSDEIRKRAPTARTNFGLYLLAAGLAAYAWYAASETGILWPALLLLPGLALLLPPTRAKLGVNPSLGISTAVALIFLVSIAVLTGVTKAERESSARQKMEQDSAARIAKNRADRTAEFANNKLKIIAEVEHQLANNQPREAAATINKFMLVTKDPDLGRLQHRANVQVMRLDLQENEAGLPLERRSAIYTALMAEDPAKREEYEAKLAQVNSKLEAQREEQQKAAMRAAMAAGIESQFSQFDGSHRQVEAAIKARLKDPSSYQHVNTRYAINETTITVYTTYRAKNSFNAVTTGLAMATVDANGNVLSLN